MVHRNRIVLFASLWVVAMALAMPADAQNEPKLRDDFIGMDQRIEQVLGMITGGTCAVAEQGIQLGLEALYGGLRPLPSGGLREATLKADRMIADNERKFANALDEFARGGDCPAAQARALDLKLFIEQMNEVALAVGRITERCVAGRPCEGLAAVLDEETGHEIDRPLHLPPARPLQVGFSAKIRSPFVPGGFTRGWEEDPFLTEPIARGECVAIFKETRGLMLKLHLKRIDIVRDPWATATLARGTKIPIFALEWIPSQYGKTWSFCNHGEGGVKTTVTQRVKQDIPLTYFWRYYGSAKRSSGY